MSCSRCGEGTLERDSSGCEDVYVCTSCACVLKASESDLSLERTGIERGTFVFSDNVIRDTGRKVIHCGLESKRNARKYTWLERLDQMSKLLRIPPDVSKVADNYFKRAYELASLKYKREALIPSCIYAACRVENVPLTLKQLSECCYKSVPEIGRTFKLLARELGLELPVIRHEQIVESVCSQVGIPDTIVSKVVGTAKRLCGLLDEIGMSDHKGANLLAGVCVAIAFQAKQPTKHGKIPCAGKFVKVCHTHNTTFSKTYVQVRDVLVQLCKHLPWIKGDINEHHVLIHLEKILDFQRILIEKSTQQLEMEREECSDDEINNQGQTKRKKVASTETEGFEDDPEATGCYGTVSFSEDDLRMELDERDIPDRDMIKYIRTEGEIDRTVSEEDEDECHIPG